MATIDFQAKLYQGTYCSLVDANLDLTNISANIALDCVPRKISTGVLDLRTTASSSFNGSYFRKGGVANPQIVSSLTCSFPTYIQIDVDRLELPEGVEVVFQMEEGFVLEGNYPESKRSPLPLTNLVTFKVPKKLFGQLIASEASLSANMGFLKVFDTSMPVNCSIGAKITYNPGRFASIEVSSFTFQSSGVKTVNPTSTMNSQFTLPSFEALNVQFGVADFIAESLLDIDNTRVRLNDSQMSDEFIFSANSVKYKGISNLELLSNSSISVEARASYDPSADLQSSFAMTCDASKFVGFEQHMTVTSTLNNVTDMVIVYQTDLNYTDYLGNAITPTTTVYLPIAGGAFQTNTTNLTIDWGDGSTSTITQLLGISESELSHTYDNHGTYEVRIKTNTNTSYVGRGLSVGHPLGESSFNPNWQHKVKEIKSWGVKSFRRNPGDSVDLVFSGLFKRVPENVNFKIIDHLPKVKSDELQLTDMFKDCRANLQGVELWDLNPTVPSFMTTLYNAVEILGVFTNAKNFNSPIGNWDLRKIEAGSGPRDMFDNDANATCDEFNQDLGGWKVNPVSVPTNLYMLSDLNLPALSEENYNKSLIGWANSIATGSYPNWRNGRVTRSRVTETSTVYGSGTYTTGLTAKAFLETRGWTFN
jgi:hypothetical protein